MGSFTGRKHTPETLSKMRSTQTALARGRLLSADFDTLSIDRKRRRIIIEQAGACVVCKLDSWLGVPMVLELDHVDGDGENGARDNLRMLCPNCHSQTPTWRGRRATRFGCDAIGETALRSALMAEPTIRQALLSLGVSAEGGNYTRARNTLKRMRDAGGPTN